MMMYWSGEEVLCCCCCCCSVATRQNWCDFWVYFWGKNVWKFIFKDRLFSIYLLPLPMPPPLLLTRAKRARLTSLLESLSFFLIILFYSIKICMQNWIAAHYKACIRGKCVVYLLLMLLSKVFFIHWMKIKTRTHFLHRGDVCVCVCVIILSILNQV